MRRARLWILRYCAASTRHLLARSREFDRLRLSGVWPAWVAVGRYGRGRRHETSREAEVDAEEGVWPVHPHTCFNVVCARIRLPLQLRGASRLPRGWDALRTSLEGRAHHGPLQHPAQTYVHAAVLCLSRWPRWAPCRTHAALVTRRAEHGAHASLTFCASIARCADHFDGHVCDGRLGFLHCRTHFEPCRHELAG